MYVLAHVLHVCRVKIFVGKYKTCSLDLWKQLTRLQNCQLSTNHV